MRTAEAVQIDPVSVVAQSHDIMLWGRVASYRREAVFELAYDERKFFDYGSHLHFYPMAELPFWRVVMERQKLQERWVRFSTENSRLLEDIRSTIRERGPVRSRDLDGRHIEHYRAGKDTGVALYYLWISGELMTSRRHGKERIHDFLENVAPKQYQTMADATATMAYFIQKSIFQRGMIREREFRTLLRSIADVGAEPVTAAGMLDDIRESGKLRAVEVLSTGKGKVQKETCYTGAADAELVRELSEGSIPKAWRVFGPTTEEEVVFLSPLEYVSARGRARWLFDFDYTWEIYKPAHKRTYGPYTLPVLYGDRLVARTDFRHDRREGVLFINGIWLEPWFEPNTAFMDAFSRGLRHFSDFLGAETIDLAANHLHLPESLRPTVDAVKRRL